MDYKDLIRRSLGVPDAVVEPDAAVAGKLFRFFNAERPANANVERQRYEASKELAGAVEKALESGRLDEFLMGWEDIDEAVNRTYNYSGTSVGHKLFKDGAKFVLTHVAEYVGNHPFEDD